MVMKLAVALTLFLILRLPMRHGATTNQKHYVVYMGDSPPLANSELVIDANLRILASIIGSVAEAQSRVVHHYIKSFRGFSAMLTPEQAQKLEGSNEVVSVFESKMNRLHTTHSWDFLRIKSIWRYNLLPAKVKSDVIVGIIDSGIWPESKSFNDRGLGPVPEKFKGECITGDNFTIANCNRKIIGARFYYKGYEAERGSLNQTWLRSARDDDGHGTHVASIVAGASVRNVSLLGMGGGTARGGVPSARLSIYKVTWFGHAADADILAAMDDAIRDGVHIISLSLGAYPYRRDYFHDPISIGAFHALQNGILVCASAGNSFDRGTVENFAPWIFTVGATTIDREFRTKVELGNSLVLKGSSLNRVETDGYHELIAGSDARAEGVSLENASFCREDSLDLTKIQGKIVACNGVGIGYDIEAGKAGGVAGFILNNSALKENAYLYPYPTAVIDTEEANILYDYMTRVKKSVAKISKTITVLNFKPAPKVAVFSSRGPSLFNPDIIKPDVGAPGVDILGAWSPLVTDDTYGNSVDYNIESGTSISCPHIAAIAAIIKSVQPYWTPATLKSAIMTTATNLDNTEGNIKRLDARATPFDFGSGQVDAVAASNADLTYDLGSNDFLDFLCGIGASPAQLKNLTEGITTDCKSPKPSYNLNYPSIGVQNMNGSLTVTRTLTYHGCSRTTYAADVKSPPGVITTVTPSKLEFRNDSKTKSFWVTFKAINTSSGSFVFGSLTWSNGVKSVRSPIALSVLSTI